MPGLSIFTGGFTINAGPVYGYMHVYTNPSTVFAGGSPKVGLYAQSTGTGSMSTNLTAGFVGLYASAPSSVTLSGTAAKGRTLAVSWGGTVLPSPGVPPGTASHLGSISAWVGPGARWRAAVALGATFGAAP